MRTSPLGGAAMKEKSRTDTPRSAVLKRTNSLHNVENTGDMKWACGDGLSASFWSAGPYNS